MLPARVVVYYACKSLRAYEEVHAPPCGGGRSIPDHGRRTGRSRPQARSRRRVSGWAEPLRRLFEAGRGSLRAARYPGAWLGPRRLMAIDGFVLDIPDTKDNDTAFGRSGGEKNPAPFPQVRAWWARGNAGRMPSSPRAARRRRRRKNPRSAMTSIPGPEISDDLPGPAHARLAPPGGQPRGDDGMRPAFPQAHQRVLAGMGRDSSRLRTGRRPCHYPLYRECRARTRPWPSACGNQARHPGYRAARRDRHPLEQQLQWPGPSR